MKTYKYVARDFSGNKKEGTRQAASSNDVLGFLREQGYVPVFVEEIVDTVQGRAPKKARWRRIRSSDLAAFCWQFSTMIEGGISITTALDTIADDMDNLYFREVLKKISESINKGESFLGGVSRFPNIFNRLARAIILAGESGGNLAGAVKRLADYYENRDKLAKKVKGAMAYPIFVVSFIFLILIMIMTFIIPRFRVMFEQFGSKLPAFTRGFMRVYDIICHNVLFIIGITFFIIMAVYLAYTKTNKGHRFFSALSLKLPLFGKIFSQSFISMYCRTMSTLLVAGVSVLEVFDILSEMTHNDVIRESIVKTKGHIVEGRGIAASMSMEPFFPNMVVKMTQVGEESGSMPIVLEKTADYYERKVESTIHTVTTLIEPIMIVTIGAIVLVVVLALYLPIFTISDFGNAK
jgi:type IV pilus assembly protein PilC